MPTPGNPMSPDPTFYLDPIYAKLENLSALAHAYNARGANISIDTMADALEKGWARAELAGEDVPPPHSAYSSRLPEGRKQKMHSRNLPLN